MADFPTGRTAFVVIHGIGEQKPFETLDGFGRGLLGQLERQGTDFRLAHRLRRHPQGWTESYLRIAPQQGESFIDLHEVYWAYLTEDQISAPEVYQWLKTTLDGAKRLFAANQELIDRYEAQEEIDRLTEINRSLRWLAWLYPLIDLAFKTLGLFGSSWLRPLRGFLDRKLNYYLSGYLGDVAIYTTTDRKSKFFNLRQKILADSLAMLRQVLNDPEIERVVLCGHSLGSVIAYDSLNRLQLDASLPDDAPLPLEKLKGLVTFGSPLDKIAFFFRERAEKEQWLRRAIIGQLHSFKSKQLDFNGLPFKVTDPGSPVLQDLPWVNYWDRKDPVSGRLNLYRIAPEDNVEFEMGMDWGAAHVGYWGFGGMYEDLMERVLGS